MVNTCINARTHAYIYTDSNINSCTHAFCRCKRTHERLLRHFNIRISSSHNITLFTIIFFYCYFVAISDGSRLYILGGGRGDGGWVYAVIIITFRNILTTFFSIYLYFLNTHSFYLSEGGVAPWFEFTTTKKNMQQIQKTKFFFFTYPVRDSCGPSHPPPLFPLPFWLFHL